MSIVLRAIFVLAFISNAFAGNHGESHHMEGNSPEWEIKAYTSAAPSFIGNHATVIGASGEVLREGTNGWRCEPFMPMPKMALKIPMRPQQHVLTKMRWHGPTPTKPTQPLS